MCLNCKSKGSLQQTVAAKKTVPRIFFKNHRNLPDTFLLETRKQKWGSPCSFLLYEQNCLLPSLTQLPDVPNKAITRNPVQIKTVASNGLDMAQSVELWTLDQLDRDSLPVQQGITSSVVTNGSSYLKRIVPPPEIRFPCRQCFFCGQRRTILEFKSLLFCFCPLLNSVILPYCVICSHPEEGVYIVCESLPRGSCTWSIKPKGKETQAKDPTFVLGDDEVELVLTTTALPQSIICFDFEDNFLRNKNKNWAATGSDNETGAIFISLTSHCWSPWKQWQKNPNTLWTRKKDLDPKPPFLKDPLSQAFSRSSELWAERCQKAPDLIGTCGHLWPFQYIQGWKAVFSSKVSVPLPKAGSFSCC